MKASSARVLALILFGACAFGQAAEQTKAEPAAPTSFTSLKAAVSFISSCLDQNDFAKLADACTNKVLRPDESLLKRLKAKHEEKPLPELYAGMEFPTVGRVLELGGHDKELGFIHILFEKEGDKWFLESIVLCR